MRNLLVTFAATFAMGTLAAGAFGVTLGQLDTFETETTEGWGGGGNVGLTMSTSTATGGPAGAGDAFLQVDTNGFHLSTMNTAQWTGDYLAAGVTGIEMDVNVFSYIDQSGSIPAIPDVQLRLVLWGPGGMWTTSSFITVPTGVGWQRIAFGVGPADLTYVQDGTGAAGDTLAGVTRLMIRHDRDPATPQGGHPPHTQASMGLDNIEATPEPASIALLALGSVALIRRRR